MEGTATVQELKQDSFKWKPGKVNRWYGVAFDFKTAEKESRLSFEVHVEHVTMLNDGSYHFRISRSEDIYIDHYEPDLVIDEIAAKCSKFIYPLNIQVSAQGVWTGKTIHGELIKRWPDFKQKMKEDYAGGYMIHYLDKMEENLLDHKKFADSLQRDLFLTLFFSCTASVFKQDEPVLSSLFPVAPSQLPYSFVLKEKISAYEDRIEARVTGVLNSAYPAVMYSSVPSDAGLEISYRLAKDTHFIDAVWGNSFVQLASGRVETKFTAFHLADRNIEAEQITEGHSLYYIK